MWYFSQKGIHRFGEIKFDLIKPSNIYNGSETGPLKKIE